MASDDSSLIAEARGLTDYDSSIFTNPEIKEIVQIAKQEIRADLGQPDLSFYTEDTFQATRALFWFVCIGLKIKAGEIAGINLEIGDLRTQNPAQGHYSIWFESFRKRMAGAERQIQSGPSSVVLERDNRSYGE